MNEQISEEKTKITWIKKTYSWLCKGEPFLCFIILAVALCYGFWPLLSAPNTNYPMTVDGMGHLAKVQYLSDCIKNLNWPSWFPYWYNGSTVMQYYPPLSYILLVPVQILFDNIMITFKFYGFASLFIGGIGVWYTCRRYIGPLVGIWAGVIYVLNPFLARSLFLSGVVAQGPVFAFSPWLLYLTLLFFERKNSKRWVAIAITVTLLILSHAMHAFIITMIIGIVALVLLVIGSIKYIDMLAWFLSVLLGAGLASYWWIPGVTQLETYGIPYLLPEAAKNYAAKIEWFTMIGRNGSWFYFGLSVLIFALIPLLLSTKGPSINKILYKDLEELNNRKRFLALGIGLVASIIFSFGYKLPFFKYLPMHDNLVSGRILSFSACLAAILCAKTVWIIATCWRNKYLGIISWLFIVISSAVILIDINPRILPFYSSPCLQQQADMALIPARSESFQNGRFAWIWPCNSDISYFPMLHKLNMTDGWNIEGSLHNRAIWQHNIAIPNHCSHYVVRNLLSWNTRSVYIDNRYNEVIDELKKRNFIVLKKDSTKTVLFKYDPSSYFYRQKRDALVLGKAALSLEMNFPWMIRGYSTFLEDYKDSYLIRFKLIYLIEPEYRDFEEFQRIVEKLAKADKIVIVSMGRDKTFPLLDIIPYWENIDSKSQIITTNKGPLEGTAILEADPGGQVPAIGNTDMLWAAVDGAGRKIPAIGYKEVKGHKVYFVGLALGQQLNSSHGKEMKNMLEQLMDLAHPNKSIMPTPFPINQDEWYYDGFKFDYNTKQPAPIQVSVTYTPRWKASIDGKPWPVENMENLIYIKLPAGQHRVSFHYGMTWVGWLGIGLSLLSLLMLIAIYYYFDKIERISALMKNGIKKFIRVLGK